MAVEIRVLGPVEVVIDAATVPVGHARQQCVLAALAVNANRPTSANQLVDQVWGDHPPNRASGVLHSYLSRLRKALSPSGEVHIARRPDGYVFTADPSAVDLHLFRRLAVDAKSTESDTEAASLLQQALALWRGPAFGELDTPWLNLTREALDAERLAVELDYNDIALRQGRHADLLTALVTAVSAHPWDERIAAQQMLALYRCGRQGDALQAYEQLRRRLADELGADPSPPLQELHLRILSADPTLAATDLAQQVFRDGTVTHPRQLPASSALFTGRIAELDELSAMLGNSTSEGPTIAAISGAGGVGKTWLAMRWANAHAADYPDGQLYVNLHGFDPVSEPVPPAAAMHGFLDALGVEPTKIPVDLEAQASLFRSVIADRRILIVLDNARDSSTVGPLIPGTANSSVIITSRRRLTGLAVTHGVRTLTVDVMSEADARDLLSRHLGHEPAEDDRRSADDILRHCAGLPLALAIAAAQLPLRSGTSMTALADELRKTTTRLDALDAGELAVNLRAVLSCSTRALSPDAYRLFELLGLFQGPDFSLSAAASLVASDVEHAQPMLAELSAAHLIQEAPNDRYRMHDLVRLFAVELGAGGAEASQAVARLLDHYLHSAHAAALLLSPHRPPLILERPLPGVTIDDLGDLDAAMNWFSREHPALVATIRQAEATGFDRVAIQLPWTLATYFDRRGHWHEWAAAQRIAVDAAQRIADPETEAQARRLLANAYSNLRRYDDALEQLQYTLQLYEEQKDDDGRAHVHFDVALLSDRQGEPAQALHHAQQSLAFYRMVPNQLGEAVALNAVGWYHAETGQYRQAIACCEQALDLSTEIGSAYGRSNALDSLGYAYHRLEDYTQAVDSYHQAIELFREMGDHHAEAIALDHLGDSLDAAGNRTEALEAWTTALEQFEQLGHPEAEAIRAKLDDGRIGLRQVVDDLDDERTRR
jgi:DNA-binding SARP family transcriptional activator/tetratricopeptide (TPR) repeat protein